MFDVSIYTLLLWITGVLIASFDIVVYLGSSRFSSKIFAIFSFFVALWSISYGFLISATSSEVPHLLIKIDHMLGMTTTLGFVYFSLVYPNDIKPNRKIVLALFLIEVIFLILFFFSDLMIPGMKEIAKPDHWAWQTGKLYVLYGLVFNFLWIIILTNIWTRSRLLHTITERKNQMFMFWGLTLGIIPPAVLNIILPTFGYYGASWSGPIISAIWIYIIGYSIIRYRQMNVRAVITEVLAIGMTVIFFINIFLKTPFRVWDNVITFFVFLILAAYLIRGVLKEAKQTEMLRDLNDNLALKVAEQTVEIRKSYELEKKARRDLEKLNEMKDQFIMITQHHLRAPVTNIRCELEALLTDKNEKLDSETKKGIGEAHKSLGRLSKIVDDFLAISTLKIGGKILNINSTSLLPIIEDVLDELHFDIETKRLKVEYDHNKDRWPEVMIDASKIREAFLIIIENAVKYNIIGGRIEIRQTSNVDNHLITVSDSGVGIDTKDKEMIFNHHFHRSKEAREANPIGMGIGLSVARAIVNAHHGSLTIESEGASKGSTVKVILPKGNWNDLI